MTKQEAHRAFIRAAADFRCERLRNPDSLAADASEAAHLATAEPDQCSVVAFPSKRKS